jgi:hypothetical protein
LVLKPGISTILNVHRLFAFLKFMVWLLSVFTLVSAALALVHATAVEVKRQTITALTPEQIYAFEVYARFASAAYCDPSTIKEWNCGGASIHSSTLEARLEAVLLKRCFHSQLPRGPFNDCNWR